MAACGSSGLSSNSKGCLWLDWVKVQQYGPPVARVGEAQTVLAACDSNMLSSNSVGCLWL